MSFLLDVNVLLACGWETHDSHRLASRWLAQQRKFFTCPILQLGFLRISMTPAFGATFEHARDALSDIVVRRGSIFLGDDLPAEECGPVAAYSDVTDAYLVALARKHDLRLATLDDALCARRWAEGIAVNLIHR